MKTCKKCGKEFYTSEEDLELCTDCLDKGFFEWFEEKDNKNIK